MSAEKSGRLVVGGEIILGRRANAIEPSEYADVLGGLDVFRQADLSIVNLECVVSSRGAFVPKPGEISPYYFRGRPETLNILKEAQIDLVSLANNHSLDYGPDAFLETLGLLDESGIEPVGGGVDMDAARKPVIRMVGDISVAFIGVDFIAPYFSAGAGKAGSYYCDPNNSYAWREGLSELIEQTKKQAHLVFLYVHWGHNFAKKPQDLTKALAHILVEVGADAVLGASAHVMHGVDVIDGCPVLYDCGMLFADFDGADKVSGVFELELSVHGVESIKFIPVKFKFCETSPAGAGEAFHMSHMFVSRCEELGTQFVIRDGYAEMDLTPPKKAIETPLDVSAYEGRRALSSISPLQEPHSHYMVDHVPEHCAIEPIELGPLTLLGFEFDKNILVKGESLIIDSYWTLSNDEIDRDFRLVPVFIHEKRYKETVWQQDHDPCDWMWPTSRWKKGVIYHDRFFMRPSPGNMVLDGRYDFLMCTIFIKNGEQYKKNMDTSITMKLPK